jgi:hypothetical protein
MKINVAIVLLVLVACFTLNAQERSDIFDPKTKVTWLGIDFSAHKFIGDRERLGSESDIRHLIDAWNDLILKEADKYNIADAIGRRTSTFVNEIDVTKEHNAELDVISMYSGDKKDYLHLTKEGVDEIIAGYDFKGLSGIGLMFNAESFSKLNGEAAIWITFVNLESKEVYFSERMVSPPVGSGMRNYWAGAMVKIIERIKKKEFEAWRKKFSQ